MAECIFCAIVKKQPTTLIFEDETAVALPDISPKAPVHLLIVPKKHVSSINEIGEGDELVLGHLFTVAKQLAKEKELAQLGFRLVVNTGPDAGQSVQHLHMHLLGGEPLGRMNTAEEAGLE